MSLNCQSIIQLIDFQSFSDQLRRMVLDLVLNDVIVKTGLCGSFTQLFGPASPFVTMTIAMMNCMGFPEWHRLIVFLRSESLPLQFSPENMLAIGQTQELLEKWIEEMVGRFPSW